MKHPTQKYLFSILVVTFSVTCMAVVCASVYYISDTNKRWKTQQQIRQNLLPTYEENEAAIAELEATQRRNGMSEKDIKLSTAELRKAIGEERAMVLSGSY